jgi:hypothetical protein
VATTRRTKARTYFPTSVNGTPPGFASATVKL